MIQSAGRRAVIRLILGALAMTSTTFDRGAAQQATPVGTSGRSILYETPGKVPVSMLVRNLGSQDDLLLGARSAIARRVELHQSPLIDGVRVMEPITSGVVFPSGSTTIFEPESNHLMLVGLQKPLIQGATFPMVLHFQRTGEVSVTGRVRRKVDAAGVTLIPPVAIGDIEISLVSAPPAPVAH